MKNVYVLYFVFFISMLNIGWFLYNNNHNSLIAFTVLCLAIYIMNQNMIIVLSISIILVNVFTMFNVIKIVKEGFKEGKGKSNAQKRREAQAAEDKRLADQIEANRIKRAEKAAKKALERAKEKEKALMEQLNVTKSITNAATKTQDHNQAGFKNKDDSDSDDNSNDDSNSESENEDEDSKYMEDKSIIKKLKKLNPNILNTLMNINHGHIDEINDIIKNLTNENMVDP
jgi:FtsZ-interacting cell division protein ZipA